MRGRLLRCAVFLFLCASLIALAGVTPASTAPGIPATRVLASMDTYAASGTDWANNPRGQGPGLYVGYGDSRAFNLGQTETFLRWDLSTSSGWTVRSAALRLYVAFATYESSGQRMTIEARRVTANWNEATLTWNNKPTFERNRVEASATLDTSVGRWIEWPLPKALVQSWVDSPLTNFGIALVDPDASRPGPHIRNFYSLQYSDPNLRPYLDIDYEPTPTPPPPPTSTPTSTATQTPTPTATFTPTPSPTPTRLWLRLANQPAGAVEASGYITYTIDYGNGGPEPLSDVVITGSVLSGANVVPHSGSRGATPFATPGGAQGLTWHVSDMPGGGSDRVRFLAQIHTPTPSPIPSATPPPTLTSTAIPSVTATPSPTAAATPTPTVTPTETETAAWATGPTSPRSEDNTPTATATVVPTTSATPTATGTATPTATPTATRTADPQRVVNVMAGAAISSRETGWLAWTYVYNGQWYLYVPLLQRNATPTPMSQPASPVWMSRPRKGQ